MSRILALALIAGLPAVATVGCSSGAPKTTTDRHDLDASAKASLDHAMTLDPTLKPVIDRSLAYAVFPDAGKGGFIVGGGYGSGVLYEHGVITGYCAISEGEVGLLIGGQSFSQLLVFTTSQALSDFKDGKFALKADASAVALKAGAAGKSVSTTGVDVYIYSSSGLMADASVGGETITFTPINALPAGAKMEGEKEGTTPAFEDDHSMSQP